MVGSVSLSELSEQINSVQQRLEKKLNLELDVLRDLSIAVKSYKDDPESLKILLRVVKLIFDINDSVKVLNEATSNAVFSLLADCIKGTFNLLKKNNIGCKNLCNDIVNLVLVMAQKDPEAPNLLLKHISNSLITIVIHPKLDTMLKRDFLKILNYILENSDRPLRYKFRNYTKLEKLGKLLHKCGDYDFQVNIIETIFRYTSTEDRKLNAIRWFNDANGLISAFLNIVDFEPDCRKFLNLFNCSLMNERLVYSIPCCRAIIGNCEIEKPEHPSYKEFWVDFNLGSKSLSLVCSQASLYSNSVLASQTTSEIWETILIESHIIKKVHLRQVSLPKGLQGVEENLWALQLTLFHPCYAIFSSIACNFEGNLCIFIFSSSNAALVNDILQPIFGVNYFSDIGNAGFKRSHKSSVSSSDFVSESDHGQKVSSINRDMIRLPKCILKEKGPQGKNNLDKEISVNHHAVISENKSVAGYQSFKDIGNSSYLPSKSKKQKSPYKPLEFINPSNSNKISNSKKAFQNDEHKRSSEPLFTEFTPKDFTMRKKSTESISILNKNTEGHNDEIPFCDSSKGNQRNLPNKEPCDSANKENCTILAEDTDENSDIMKDSQSLKESSGKVIALRKVKTSKNDPIEDFEGRVLRSHIKAQLQWDASKNKTSLKAKNNSLPLNSNDISQDISKLIEVDLNDSYSEESLKRRRKSTQNNKRTVSLGVLHMKQLYNKEVAMKKAIKNRRKKKAQSLKPSHNSPHNDHSEVNTSKKKLFNSKEKSYLGLNGEKNRDKGNVSFNIDEEVVTDGKDGKSVSSVNWFSENESESSWMKPGYKSGRFDSCIKEQKQCTEKSESNNPPCEAGEKTHIPAKSTINGEKIVYDNTRKQSGIKRDINSCSVPMEVDKKKMQSPARDSEDGRLVENKRRKFNRRKTTKNDEICKERETQEIDESNLIEKLESEFLCGRSDQNELGSNKISDPKKIQSLESNREEKMCNEAEPDAKSGSKDIVEKTNENSSQNKFEKFSESKNRPILTCSGKERLGSGEISPCTKDLFEKINENSYQNEFEKFSESSNRSVLEHSRKERLSSSETSPCVQIRTVSEMTPKHLPLIIKQVKNSNSSFNGRNKSSQDECNKGPKETILSGNLNRESSEADKEIMTDYCENSPNISYSKQKNKASISSEGNFKVKSPLMNINANQGRNCSEKLSFVKMFSENSKADLDLTSNSGRSPVGRNGKSPQKISSKDKIGAVSTKEQYEIDFTKRIFDQMEPQRKGRTDESSKVIVHSKDDNSINREALPTKENDLNLELSMNETEVLVSLQVNHEISSNENRLNRDQGIRTSNEIHNNSPDIIILCDIKNVEGSTPKMVNDREVSHQPSMKQVDSVMLVPSPRFDAYLSYSPDSQKYWSTRAKYNSPKKFTLNELPSGGRLDDIDKSDRNELMHFREQLSQKHNILEGNDALRGKTVQAPEKEDNFDLKEILSNSPTLKNFESDVDLGVLSLTEDDEMDEKKGQNNLKAACSTLMFKREDEDNQISAMKRTLPSKRQPDGVKSILIEKISKTQERNSRDTCKTDSNACHSERRRDLCKNIYSPVEINEGIFRDTSRNTGKAFDEIQEYDLNTDDLHQDNNNLTTWLNRCQIKKGRKEINTNSSMNSSGIQSRKRRVMEPENLKNNNSKVFQYDLSFTENGCNFKGKNEKKRGPWGANNSAKQQNFESENIPDLAQMLMVCFEEKMGKMKELGNLFLKYTEDGIENLKDEGIILGSKSADEYLTKLRDEIITVEETIQNSVQIQEELKKCMKNMLEKFSLKAKIDSSVIESLEKTHSICEEMHKEKKKALTSDYIEKLNSKLSSKIKQLHHEYMRMERKKELAKLQNKLKLFLHL